MGAIRLKTLNAMQAGKWNRVIGHGFLRKQKKGSLGVTRLPYMRCDHPLLALTRAPAAIRIMAEPDAAVLLPAFHLALVDRAPIGIGLIVMIVIVVIYFAILVVGDILLVMKAVVLAGQELVILEPVEGCIGFFQQVLACVTPQSELADETIRCDIPGIPGSRGFGH